MIALVLYVMTPGFACIPAGHVTLPYAGPFIMPLAEAQRMVAADHTLTLMREDAPSFDPKRCPTIY